MENMMNEVGNLQKAYNSLIESGKLTKKAMCDLVIPFRDKYGLSDLQALMIARNEMPISEMAEVMNE